MSTPASLYDLLDVPRDADSDTIRKAYYKAARVHHPDRTKSLSEGERAAHEAQFKALSSAYAVLGDPEKRKVYDATGGLDDDGQATPEQAAAAMEDAVRGLFGAGAFATFFGEVTTLPVFRAMIEEMTRVEAGRVEATGSASGLTEDERRAERARGFERDEEVVCEDLGVLLVAALRFHVRGDTQIADEMAETEAEYLFSAPGGAELLEMVATAYISEAKQHLKRGLGIESIFAEAGEKFRSLGQTIGIAKHFARMSISQKVLEKQQARVEAKSGGPTEADREALRAEEEKAKESMLNEGLEVSWKLGKFLLEARVRRVCEIVLADKGLPASLREARAEALLKRGEIFEAIHAKLEKADRGPTAVEKFSQSVKDRFQFVGSSKK
jgi:curved DNA-binding protein CbpA